MIGAVDKYSSVLQHGKTTFAVILLTLLPAACKMPPKPTPEPTLVEIGEQIFLNETFAGNGRTCGTCHRPTDNFGLTPSFIATLGDDDPLFVAETNPDLANNFENPVLMREFGLILENQDGFGDLANNFNMRGVPHTLAMRTSIDSAAGPRTGWSGDGAPGDGSLRSFATGAVIQHFTKTTNRIPGVDFRLPTDDELDALEAFQLSLGRQAEISLPLPLKGIVAARGQEIFLDNTLGKCNACHFNAGANGNPAIFGPNAGNLNFNTGVENLPDQPARLSGEPVPPDDTDPQRQRVDSADQSVHRGAAGQGVRVAGLSRRAGHRGGARHSGPIRQGEGERREPRSAPGQLGPSRPQGGEGVRSHEPTAHASMAEGIQDPRGDHEPG